MLNPRGGFLDTFPIGAPFTFIGCGYKGQNYFAPLLTFDHDLLTTRKSGHSNFMPPFVSAPRKAVGFEGTKLIPKTSSTTPSQDKPKISAVIAPT
jgi:hypothetical protein